jgi:hypothetical protein
VVVAEGPEPSGPVESVGPIVVSGAEPGVADVVGVTAVGTVVVVTAELVVVGEVVDVVLVVVGVVVVVVVVVVVPAEVTWNGLLTAGPRAFTETRYVPGAEPAGTAKGTISAPVFETVRSWASTVVPKVMV